jgi:hypothetical protein
VSKAIPNLWPDVRREAPTLLPWLRLALCAAGRKVTGALPWMAALCPSWVLLRQGGRTICSPVHLILLCAAGSVAGILFFHFDTEHQVPWSLTPYLVIGLGLVAALASLWRFA